MTATNRAPAACARRPISGIGSSRPRKSGWAAMTPATGRSGSASIRSSAARSVVPAASPSVTSGISSSSQPALEIGLRRRPVVRMDAARDEDTLAARRPAGHQGGFGRRGGPVVVRCRDDVEVDQLGQQRLVLVDALERPLADLGLVGRVGRVPLAAQEELVDRGRAPVAVDAGAQERGEIGPVAGGQAGQAGGQLELRLGFGEVELRRAQADRDVLEQLVDGGETKGRQHPLAVVGGMGTVWHRGRSAGGDEGVVGVGVEQAVQLGRRR